MLVCNYTFRKGISWDEILKLNVNSLSGEGEHYLEDKVDYIDGQCIFIRDKFVMFHPNRQHPLGSEYSLSFGHDDYTILFDMKVPEGVNPFSSSNNYFNFLTGYSTNRINYEFIFHKSGMWVGQRGTSYDFKHSFSTINEIPSDGKWHNYCILRKDRVNYWYYDGILQSTIEDNKNYQLVDWGRFFAVDSGTSDNLHAYFDNIKVYKNEARFPRSLIISNIKEGE